MRTSRLDRDAGHPKATGVDVQQGVDTCNPVGQISAKTKAVLELVQGNGGDDFGRLVDLYGDADSFMDEGIKSAIEAKVKEEISRVKTKLDGGRQNCLICESYRSGEPEILGEDTILSKLLGLEKIQSTATDALRMFIFRLQEIGIQLCGYGAIYVSLMVCDVNPKSDEFLRKHLETYGDDEDALGNYIKNLITTVDARHLLRYTNRLRSKRLSAEQMPGFEAKGDYNKLVQFRKSAIISL